MFADPLSEPLSLEDSFSPSADYSVTVSAYSGDLSPSVIDYAPQLRQVGDLRPDSFSEVFVRQMVLN